MRKSDLPADIVPQRNNEHGAQGSAKNLQTEKPLGLERAFAHGTKDSMS